MGFTHLLKIKEGFMKNIKFKRVYLLDIAISVIISLGIVSIFGFKYLAQVHRQYIRHSKTLIQTHQRIDLLEEQLKESCLKHHKNVNTVEL